MALFSIFLAWYFFLFDIINSYVYYKLRANWIFFKNNRTSFPLVKLYFFDIKLLIRAKTFTTVRYFCIFVLREYNSWKDGTILKIFKIFQNLQFILSNHRIFSSFFFQIVMKIFDIIIYLFSRGNQSPFIVSSLTGSNNPVELGKSNRIV